MSNFSKRILAVLVSVCLLVPCMQVMADVTETAPATQKLERVERKLDLKTVPEVIGTELATERKHLERRYDKEESLYNVVFENADGTETLYMFDYPVKYKTESGEIKDIKLDIKQDAKKPGTFVAADHKVQTTFSKELSDGIKLKDEDVSVTLQPKLPKLPTANVKSDAKIGTSVSAEDFTAKLIDEKTVSYRYDDKTSLEYSLTYTGFKEDIVVSEYTGQTEYEFILLTEGLKLEQNDGSYYLTDENGEIKATLGDIIIFTADERNNAFGSMTHETIRENQEYKLTIHVDADYLRDEATVYPIRIDPPIEINYDNNGTGGIEDVTINSAAGSSGTSGSLFVGKRANYGISRTLMRFPELNLSEIPNAECITSAMVEIRDIMCEAEAVSVYCHIFTGNTWSESTANWSNVNPDSYIRSPISSVSVSYSAGVNMSTKHRYSFNITEAVRGWKINNYSPYKGVMFAASPSVETGSTNISKTFASYNRASNKPSLVVNYDDDNTALIEEGKYCINNLYYAKTLLKNLVVNSAKYTRDDKAMFWKIQRVSGGYVIRAESELSKYLAVSMNSASDALSIYTIDESTIHPSCLWEIESAGNGGYYFKSVMKSAYLYYDGTTLRTLPVSEMEGPILQQSCTWRMAKQHEVYNYELDDNAQFAEMDLWENETVSIFEFFKEVPPNALWVGWNDFKYESADKNFVTINSNGMITTKTIGTADVKVVAITVTHKPTGRTYDTYVIIRKKDTYLGTLASWENCENRRIGRWKNNVKVYENDIGAVKNPYFSQACATAYAQWSAALGITITKVNNEADADITIYSGTREEINAVEDIGFTIMWSQAGNSNSDYEDNYEGYYMYNGSPRFLFEITKAEVGVAYESNLTLDDYRSTITHELGHALGYIGHSSSNTDVMYFQTTGSDYTLSNNEIAHLSQVYE